MYDEKDMIEISLNEAATADGAKTAQRLGFRSPRLAQLAKGGPAPPPYRSHRNDGTSAAAVSCLRQLYCPGCQQRLDVASVRQPGRTLFCCLPFLAPALERWQLRLGRTRLECGKCGGQLAGGGGPAKCA